jgi:hypothetical protein
MACKGICIHHKASGRYATGHKRCQTCDLFMDSTYIIAIMMRMLLYQRVKLLLSKSNIVKKGY